MLKKYGIVFEYYNVYLKIIKIIFQQTSIKHEKYIRHRPRHTLIIHLLHQFYIR